MKDTKKVTKGYFKIKTIQWPKENGQK